MPPPAEATVPSMRRVRKSIGAVSMKKTMDKENATVDVASTLAANRNKSRSKSMGPGGLDALKHTNGNRRASIAAPTPRSILKPTAFSVPEISPLRNGNIHTRSSIEPRDSTKSLGSSNGSSTNGSKVALRTEEEQQAAAREREERERRDARRKSLANRRVSFAAEATLHTFHEIEYMLDSTTSTDSTSRAPSANGTDLLGTVPKSPDNQTSSRRNSGLPPMNFIENDDDTLTSTIYSSDSEPADGVEEIEEDSGSSSDSDDGTMMTIETEEVTGTTVASERDGSDDESSTLEQALRAAAHRAGTQRLDTGNDGDSDEGEEIIPSFGWAKKNQQSSSVDTEKKLSVERDDSTNMDMDMDMTSAVGGIIKPQCTMDITQVDDMSMDVTQALGGILSQEITKRSAYSQPAPRQVDQDDATVGATMEFTTAIGSINKPQNNFDDDSDTNEDFSMEFTAAMGGVLPQSKNSPAAAGRSHTLSRWGEIETEGTMDMTVGYGNILSHVDKGDHTTLLDEDTMGMDITAAIGGILGNTSSLDLGKRILKEEAVKPHSPGRAIMAAVAQRTPTRRSSRLSAISQAATPTRKPESPGLSAFQGRGLRRSTEPQTPDTVSSPLRTPTSSPPKPPAPRTRVVSSATPAQGTRSKSPRSTTPQRRGSVKAEKSPLSIKSSKRSASLFQSDAKTGARTPTVVLTPQTRRLSGLGADKRGLGSPHITALFEKRSSIGESDNGFVPGRSEVVFEDPKIMEDEVDRERKDEEVKENRQRHAPQQDKDATFNLREMIDSLSPKRNPTKGRKSLHVGSARGLLGKRPMELESDDDSDSNDGVKRLKGRQGSPVKNIKLQQPPSVTKTTGRPTRASIRSLEPNTSNSASSFSSPLKKGQATTPQGQGRFKNMRDNQTVHEVDFHQYLDDSAEDSGHNMDDGRIHLQDFLSMTSIRFMELTTTKRRHTIAPQSLQDGSTVDGGDSMTLESCVVAGACTVPMLELYQHSCRELKNYIAEGRRIVKKIEAETLEDNPPLFREYISATPDVKALMDNQFKNVKTHARLLSKAMWYEWRAKLQEGLKEGLLKVSEDMREDEIMLKEREDLLVAVLPNAVVQFEALEEETRNLEEVANELADCDPSELQGARDELTALDADMKEKKIQIAELRQRLGSSAATAEDLTLKKQDLQSKIQQSEKIREACRGWTSSEVEELKARVDAIEKQYGWAVTSLSGTILSMAYEREIEIVFDVASFQPHQHNSRIDLWYIGDKNDAGGSKTAEKEFFLQRIRDHVRALPQNRTKILDLLNIVRTAWDKARFVISQISTINVTFPTNVAKTSDTSVAVTSSLLLTALRTRVETTLHLHGQSIPQGIDIGISTQVKVVYGEHFNVGKVGEFLATKIGDRIGVKQEGWSDILVELQKRLIARGKKQVSGLAQ
ncbi:hypothetical protein QQS21_007487 [Conoideocrella luteorostrata]|uniref:Spc7 kinetochore protein domain-containing protein n=1 Tax=Conoideocrella luteorostrata TaxID=1105319 RepID=A0AAJ0CKL3_9HYPO|nr:hypothetical protein QQS21_007487 [Conoideocrella luteorostrata]